ncbi:Hypothetical protein GLP15_4202 [Giardia lamblia P15]|uniref:Leucine-rich repeat protein n=1 Tax=Giardia intestinalis (strain P15) TaxID=658858 RepID=E1F0K1_GIAIA|nr:Hypothetical protein GLP15_4202 [Giardia lamblia P15]
MQPWKPVDTIRDSIIPLFYANSPARSESNKRPKTVSPRFRSAPCTLHPAHSQGLLNIDDEGKISIQSVDLTKEMAIAIRRQLSYKSIAETPVMGTRSSKACQLNTPVRSLDLEGCKLTRTLLEIIFEGIKECRSLECLSLAGNNLLQKEVYCIIDWFIQSPVSFLHIRKLSYSGSFRFTSKSIHDLLLAIFNHCIALEILHLSNCNLCDEHMEYFQKFMELVSNSSRPLRELHLNQNDIGTRGCRRLLDARDTFLPQLKILAHGNPASESLIFRLHCPSIYIRNVASVTTTPISLESSKIQIESNGSASTNDMSSYIEQPDCAFQGELRSGLLLFIKQTLGDDPLNPLDKKTTTELCMHCISAIHLRMNDYSASSLFKEIKDLIELKNVLEKSGLPFSGPPLTIESPAADALSVAIHLIQSLLQIASR